MANELGSQSVADSTFASKFMATDLSHSLALQSLEFQTDQNADPRHLRNLSALAAPMRDLSRQGSSKRGFWENESKAELVQMTVA